MIINIVDELNKKEKNFKDGLEIFFKEYQATLGNPNSFKQHSESCVLQSGKTTEAFCKYMILNSDKNVKQKIDHTGGVLKSLIQNLTGDKQTYLSNSKDKEVLRGRLERVLQIRNDSVHDTDYIVSKTDLDELKVILCHLSDFAFGEKVTESIVKSVVVVSSESTSKESISIIINGDIKGVANAGSGSVVNQTFG